MRSPTVAALTLFGVGIAIALAQLVRFQPMNPIVTGDISAPPAIEAMLKRACFDCHSAETRWPWYSRVAPFSWLVAREVELGRRQVNFSEWNSYYPLTRRRKLQWVGRALTEETMPPWAYRVIHPGSRLSADDRRALEKWIDSQISDSQSPQKE